MAMQITRDDKGNVVHIESDGHVVLTGPIRGTVTTGDGTTYDVSEVAVEVHPDHADEVAHLIGKRYEAEGHPDDVEFDEDLGRSVQRPFVYEAPAQFADTNMEA